MKIMLVGPHPPHGGGSAYSCVELAWGLRSIGHEVLHIATYRDARELEEHPELIWIPTDLSSDTLSLTPEARANMDHHLLAAYIERGPFDVIILGREFFLWHLPALRRIHHQPIVTICRGGHINRLAIDETFPIELKEELFELYRKSDRIICIARYLVEMVNNVVGADNTLFLPNPIHFPEYNLTNITPPHPTEPIRVLMAAQIKPRKRPLDAVEIVRQLALENVNVHLTICGDGSQRGEVEDTIRKYNVEEQIIIKGHVERQEVIDCLSQTEIVLLCSDIEGRPRILQEAIALGKGIVAYDNPGSREVINEWLEPWSFGRLVPIGDTVAASQAIKELAHSLRSNSEPPTVPEIPKPIDLLYQYELILRMLQVPTLEVVS